MAVPYSSNVQHIEDVSPYFKRDAKKRTMTFVGDTLTVRVPKRFEAYGLLQITDIVEALGIMDLIIDEKYVAHLHLLASITIEPSEVTTITIGNTEYVEMTLYNGDVFMTNTHVVKNQNIVYALYVEFITRGDIAYFYKYQDLVWLFDSVSKMCDAHLPVDHAIFEVIYSHLTRAEDNKFIQYRYIDPKSAYTYVGLQSVSYGPDSTTAHLIGARFDEGVLASMLHRNEYNRPFEDLLRGTYYDKSASDTQTDARGPMAPRLQ